MNANNKMNANNNRSAAAVSKKFCKVCFDAGKPESMYTSHTVKSLDVRSGKLVTTCVTLLELECRYCFKNGHTVKFCPVLEENKKMDKEKERVNRAQHQVRPQEQQKVVQKPLNVFAALAEGSDDEEDEVQMPLTVPLTVSACDEFPALMGNTKVVGSNCSKSYSCVAATPADEVRLEMLRKQRLEVEKNAASKANASNVNEFDEEQDAFEDDQSMSLDEKYGDKMYEILYEYFKNEFHRERTATVVGVLLERDIPELEELTTNRLYLEEQADEIFAALKEFDAPARTYTTEVDDW
jgi:hypothetical protein